MSISNCYPHQDDKWFFSTCLQAISTARSHHFDLLLCKGCSISKLLPWALNILELDLATQSNLHLGSFHLFLFCNRFNQMQSETKTFSPTQLIAHLCKTKFQLQDKLSTRRQSHHQPSKPSHLHAHVGTIMHQREVLIITPWGERIAHLFNTGIIKINPCP